jgi:solute carrier family 25 phosphate transporter 23/24/25/41
MSAVHGDAARAPSSPPLTPVRAPSVPSSPPLPPLTEAATRFGISLTTFNTFQALSSGAFAGAVSRSITSPLERLKVMKQVQAHTDKYHGIVGALVKMYREEGLRSFWKGNGTNVVRIAPFSAIQFFSFDVYKRLVLPASSVQGSQPSPIRTFAAGALTGITASTICYPLDLVRSVLSVQTTTNEYRGIAHTLVTIARTDGLLGLYRGLTPTLLGIAPYIAINMTTFDLLKRHYLPSRDHPQFTLINLLLGATAGFVAAGTTYPSDVVRRRLQLQGMKGVDLPKYTGTLDCIRVMVKEEGVRGLYKGMIPCFLKVVPSMAISFTVYETLRKTLHFDPPSNKPPSAG